ncbi:MAG: ABC transporter ATP-binding protein, partial [Hallerella succinigenes]
NRSSSMSTAIEFENISKQYRLGLVSTGTLSHDLNRFWQTKILHKEDPYLKVGEVNDRTSKGKSDYVWALKDINFKVEEGDVVGIIGRNGAGKSTLLKLLSRVTAPTTGTIRARGRIASLLEVGTGFHPEMTGRENIYMNGAIMGMTRAEITRKLDEIVDFSGCERYLDTPVKRYSSGMTVRLGFAIAAHLEPEILVVDEVLAVGDAEFQKKAIGKMQDVSKGEGRTVLFVSHNMGAVKNLCKTGVLLENGTIRNIGKVDDVVNKYILSGSQDNEKKIDLPPDAKNKIKSIKIYNAQGLETNNFISGEPIQIEVEIQKCDFTDESTGLGIYLYSSNQERIAGTTSFFGQIEKKSYNFRNENRTIELTLPHLNLTGGRYRLDATLVKKNECCYDYQESIAFINITDSIPNVSSHLGALYLNGFWEIK